MATVNFYLHEPKSIKATSIMLHFLHGDTKLIYSTRQKIQSTDWNVKKQRAKRSFAQAKFLNELLEKFETEALNGFRQCLLSSNSNYKDFIRNYLNERINGVKTENTEQEKEFDSQYFLDYLDLMIKESENGIRIQKSGKKISSSTFVMYRTLRYHIVQFEAHSGKRIKIILQTGKTPTELKQLKQHWVNWYAEFLEYFYSVRNLYDNAVGGNIKTFNGLELHQRREM